MSSKITKAAMALTVAGAVALPAGQAAAASKTESALIGALLGAVAGAAVGNGKTEAVAMGAVAGAALGVAADSSNDQRRYRSGHSYRQPQPYYGAQRSRYDDRGGYYRQTNTRYGYDRYDRNDRYDYRR